MDCNSLAKPALTTKSKVGEVSGQFVVGQFVFGQFVVG